MIRRLFFFAVSMALVLVACSDNDSFGTSQSDRLTFTEDTIRFDTVFSTVPSATRTFWIHNKGNDGIRIRTARLERGSQSGYRVNVDGTYLNPIGSDFEVRKGDSLLVFVEVTTHETFQDEPQLVEDNLLLTLESGVEQKVNLRTYSWDALKINDLVVQTDTLIESDRPIVVYGNGILVEQDAALTLRNTTLYFHDMAGLTVCGRLQAEGCLLRGDRLDRMFDYLPYDRVPAQWDGILITSTAKGNTLVHCEIRNAVDALVCDSSDVTLDYCSIHNSGGVGLRAHHSNVRLTHCQLTNTGDHCLALEGGETVIDQCTLAQFYPFVANRGAALSFCNTTEEGLQLVCTNTLVTGYDADVVMGERTDSTRAFDYRFSNCILRTDSVSGQEAERFENVSWESEKDSIQGTKHFRLVDEENLYYDFTIDSLSPAFKRHIGCDGEILHK